jgi:hypothetical protein
MALVLFLCISSLFSSAGAVTRYVYLNRPADSPTWEPYFSPSNISADIGDEIQFVARFDPIPANQSSTEVYSFLSHFDGFDP